MRAIKKTSSFNDKVKESLNIEQDSFGAGEVFPEAQAGESQYYL